MDAEAARTKVRQLLLSADNTVKNRNEPERFSRARLRVQEARDLAVAAGLVEIMPFIDRRLADLEPGDDA